MLMWLRKPRPFLIPSCRSISSVTSTASRPAPQLPETPDRFTAAGAGGVAQYQHKWSRVTRTTAQSWKHDKDVDMNGTSTVAIAGFTVTVWAHSAGNTVADAEKITADISAVGFSTD
jgi:hypothetical protein